MACTFGSAQLTLFLRKSWQLFCIFKDNFFWDRASHVDTHHAHRDHNELFIFLTLSQLLGLQMPNGKPGFMRCRGPCTGRRCTGGRHSRGYAKNPFQVCCIQKKTSLKKNSQECKRACLFSYLLRNQELGMETKLRFPKSKKSQYMNLKIQWDSRTL